MQMRYWKRLRNFPDLRIVISLVVFLHIGFGQGQTTISGYVLDSETGESLIGANVILRDQQLGAATNRDGYFVISQIPSGDQSLIVTYLGYEDYEKTLNLNNEDSQVLTIELTPTLIELTAVDVSGRRMERKLNSQISRVNLNVRQLKNIPQLGEADLFRTLQSLPGILTESDFSTGMVIRGGNTDQNLILLDGITVYNPSHVGGLFSNFILDAIKEAELLKGGFNAQYGGRLSAVLNVRSREGNQKRFDGKASLSLLSAQTTLEGPIGKGAWLASARRTYFDQVFKGTEIYFPYYFYDFQGHIFQDLTDRDRISLSWYTGKDDLTWDEFQLEGRWGNQTIALNYRKLFNSKLVSTWMLAKSRFDIYFNLGGSSGVNEEDYIDDLSFRSDWTYFHSQESQFQYGFEVKDLDFIYQSSFLDTVIFDIHQPTIEAAIYGKLKHWLTPVFMVEPGLRINYYEAHPIKYYFDPRLRIKYLLNADRYINAAVGVYHQFMETFQDDYNPKIMDSWFAVEPSVDPASAVHLILGYEEYFRNIYRFQLEVYYKRMRNMLTYVEDRATVDEIPSDESLSDLMDMGDGYAYGIEGFLQKEFGRLNGWLAYTWSVARKQFQGAEYFTNWDRRYAFNIVGNYQLNRKWDMNLKWMFQSGQPYTPISHYFIEYLPQSSEPYYVPIPGERNSARYPLYHRLDIGAVRHFKPRGLKVDLFLQIVNTYWRKNVFLYYYDYGDTNNGRDDDNDGKVDERDEGLPQRTRINGFPIIPTIGIAVDF